ncbi:MAG: hypothetical protein R2865_08495 [Deinococcales bacterium]
MPHDEKDLQEAENVFNTAFLATLSAIPGMVELVKNLKIEGFKLAVISNTRSHRLILDCLKQLDIASRLLTSS